MAVNMKGKSLISIADLSIEEIYQIFDVRGKKTSYEKILDWMTHPDENNCKLSKADRDKFNRWDFADTQLKRFPKRKMVVEVIRKRFGGSISRAYDDLYNAQRLFGTIHPLNKEWYRNFIIEEILLLIEASKKAGDRKTWDAALANLIKASGIEKIEELKIDPAILSQHNFYTIIQIGNVQYKYDLESFQNLPLTTRNKIVKELDREITDVQAIEIMNS